MKWYFGLDKKIRHLLLFLVSAAMILFFAVSMAITAPTGVVLVTVLLLFLDIFLWFVEIFAVRNDKKKEEKAKEAERERARKAEAARQAAKAAEFAKELDSIERVTVIPSEHHANRQHPTELPLSVKTITASTNLSRLFPLAVVDVETTGLAPYRDDIVEVCAIRYEYGFRDPVCFHTLVQPRKCSTNADAEKINHISWDMVKDAPLFANIADPLSDFLKGCNIVGHNVDFDARFLYAGGVVFEKKTALYDTLDLAKKMKGSYFSDFKLDTVCKNYGIYRSDEHRALSDCYATAKVFEKMVTQKTGQVL